MSDRGLTQEQVAALSLAAGRAGAGIRTAFERMSRALAEVESPVLDGIELGAQRNHDAVQSRLAAAPVKVRKWWNR